MSHSGNNPGSCCIYEPLLVCGTLSPTRSRATRKLRGGGLPHGHWGSLWAPGSIYSLPPPPRGCYLQNDRGHRGTKGQSTPPPPSTCVPLYPPGLGSGGGGATPAGPGGAVTASSGFPHLFPGAGDLLTWGGWGPRVPGEGVGEYHPSLEIDGPMVPEQWLSQEGTFPFIPFPAASATRG